MLDVFVGDRVLARRRVNLHTGIVLHNLGVDAGARRCAAAARAEPGGLERRWTARTVEAHHWRPPWPVGTPSQACATAALKSFFRFLVDDEQLERDPARPLRTPKKCEALPDVLTMAELERLLAAPARDDVWERSFAGKVERDRLLLALFAYAGLRRNELLGVDWDDVDLSRRLLRVRHANTQHRPRANLARRPPMVALDRPRRPAPPTSARHRSSKRQQP